jgi:hypothetical protein
MNLTRKISIYIFSYTPTICVLLLYLMAALIYLQIGYVPTSESEIGKIGLQWCIIAGNIITYIMMFTFFFPLLAAIVCLIDDEMNHKDRVIIFLGFISIIVLHIFIKYGSGISYLLWYD